MGPKSNFGHPPAATNLITSTSRTSRAFAAGQGRGRGPCSMSVSWKPTPERVVVVRISGRLEPSEWLAAQMAVSKLLNDESASSSIMVIAESFEGFARGDWND